MLRAATRVEANAREGAIPFVHDDGDGFASFGYAAAAWTIDLYAWAVSDEAVSAERRHQLVGLLLGYSPLAIARFQEFGSGRRFDASAC